MFKKFLLSTFVIGGFFIAGCDQVNASGGPNKAEVEGIIKEYLMENPELIIEALQNYEKKRAVKEAEQAKESIAARADDLYNHPGSPIAGNPNGTNIVVEFFDYNCGFCKKAFPDVQKLVETDPSVKFVFKELPILGPNSELASRAAIAVFQTNPEKYLDFHAKLMSHAGGKDIEILQKIATEIGVEINLEEATQTKEVEEALAFNRKLAQDIGASGTPAFVINGEFVGGAIGYDNMKQMIANTSLEK